MLREKKNKIKNECTHKDQTNIILMENFVRLALSNIIIS